MQMSLARAPAARTLLRQPVAAAFVARRAASTTTQATEKAKETAKDAAEGAKQYTEKAQNAASDMLNQVSSRASGLLGSYSEPIAYNLSVAREVAKQVYISEKLAPPTNPQDFRNAYEQFYQKASDASWWRSILESGEWKRVALYAVEAYGIFTIGEMIGRS